MIYFVGAGPGDSDLITVKGRRLLKAADMVIYAGSLVSKEHLSYLKKDCEVYDSSGMTLEEVIEKFKEGISKKYLIVRLHTGDPTIYGAIREQIDIIEEMGYEYEVVPGVSSFTAAAATIGKEFTLPEVSQTIILTRQRGRTPVPDDENLRDLAKHRASMALFLSAGLIDETIEELIEGYGDSNVPCTVVYRATWADEEVISGTLGDISKKVKEKGIKNQAQILVGDFLGGDYERSRLYDPTYSHAFRKAKK